jgi:hypothetical protein
MRRPNGSKELPVRSIRVSDEDWEKCKRLCADHGMTISNVMAQLAHGLAEGYVGLPQVTVNYGPSRWASNPGA